MPGNSAEPDRSPAAWTRECLRILKGINPAYERNREVTGRFIEFIRPDPSGLYLSHNFTRITSSYYLGFALLFTRRRTKVLFHPRVAGSRFDHGRYAARQFHDDLGLQRGQEGYPSGIWSFGPWRSNTLENLARGLAVDEERLYPFYRDALREGKGRLVALFGKALELVPRFQQAPEASFEAQADSAGLDAAKLLPYHEAAGTLNALAVAQGGSRYIGYGPRTNTFEVESIPLEAIVLAHRSVFLAERERLRELLAIAEAL